MKRMDQLGSRRQEFEALGAVAFIAAQKRSTVVHMPNGDPDAYVRKHPLPFPLLLDEDRKVTRAYGVYVAFNLESIRIARPASFVVGTDGVVRYSFVGSGQTDRAPVEKILTALREAHTH